LIENSWNYEILKFRLSSLLFEIIKYLDKNDDYLWVASMVCNHQTNNFVLKIIAINFIGYLLTLRGF
jgi:hypothetical protein